MAGGKGINVARALKQLGEPVIATGLAGGRDGAQIVEGLVGRGHPQRLRPHPRRVAHLDRRGRSDQRHCRPRSTSTAPRSTPDELETLLEKLRYLSGAVVGGRARRQPAAQGRDRVLRRRRARPRQRKVRTVIDSEGEPLRLALAAEPALVVAQPARGRGAGRPRVPDRRGLPAGRCIEIAEMGAASVADHAQDRLLRAAPRRAAAATACSGPGSRGSRRSRRSARGTRSWPASSRRGRPKRAHERVPAHALACGAANTQSVRCRGVRSPRRDRATRRWWRCRRSAPAARPRVLNRPVPLVDFGNVEQFVAKTRILLTPSRYPRLGRCLF